MSAGTEETDHLSLQLDLRVDAGPEGAGFRATIELRELDLVVQAVAPDITDAMRSAAERCADRLGELGCAVTTADVLAALESTLDPRWPSEPSTPLWN